jgi:hypothetical protein
VSTHFRVACHVFRMSRVSHVTCFARHVCAWQVYVEDVVDRDDLLTVTAQQLSDVPPGAPVDDIVTFYLRAKELSKTVRIGVCVGVVLVKCCRGGSRRENDYSENKRFGEGGDL